MARLGGEFVLVVVAAWASVGIAMAGAQDRDDRAFAVGERLDGHLEAAALADELEDGGVDPVDDRALELARSTIRRVVADVGGEEVLRDEDALVVQELKRLVSLCTDRSPIEPMVDRSGRSRDARRAGLPLPPG